MPALPPKAAPKTDPSIPRLSVQRVGVVAGLAAALRRL